MYFLIFQLEDMLNLCLKLNEPQPIYAYKRYSYKKRKYLFFGLKS